MRTNDDASMERVSERAMAIGMRRRVPQRIHLRDRFTIGLTSFRRRSTRTLVFDRAREVTGLQGGHADGENEEQTHGSENGERTATCSTSSKRTRRHRRDSTEEDR